MITNGSPIVQPWYVLPFVLWRFIPGETGAYQLLCRWRISAPTGRLWSVMRRERDPNGKAALPQATPMRQAHR